MYKNATVQFACQNYVFWLQSIAKRWNYWKIMGFDVYEHLTLFYGLLTKTVPILYLFSTVNINKNVFYNSDLLLNRQSLWYQLAGLT